MQQLGGRLDALGDRRLALLLHAQAEGDVVEHRHVREHGVALEDHRDPAPARRQVGGVPPADPHTAAVDLLQPREPAQQRRLPAARGPEQDDELAVRHVEVDVVDRGDLPEGLADVLEADVGH